MCSCPAHRELVDCICECDHTNDRLMQWQTRALAAEEHGLDLKVGVMQALGFAAIRDTDDLINVARQLRAERDALKAELAEYKRDHDMTAEYVGKQLRLNQALPAVTSVGCAMALGEELAEARAAIERVRVRAKSATNSGFGQLCCCFDCEEAQENGRDAPHETTWTAWTLDPAAVLLDLDLEPTVLDASQRPEDTREETGS